VLEERVEVAVSDFAEEDHERRISRLRKPQRLNTEARRGYELQVIPETERTGLRLQA
jgi:hypothetical protein